jgi:hypothetical protein
MIFSRDAVQAKLNSLANSPSERATTLLLTARVNLSIGIALFLATFFTSRAWGNGIAFQAMTTALIHGGVLWAVQDWLQRPNLEKLDVIGGAFLLLLVMLLQTTFLWNNLSSGFINVNANEPCFLTGSGGDHAVSILAGILFVADSALAVAAYKWRGDWLQNSGSTYVNLNTNTAASASASHGAINQSDFKLTSKGKVEFDDDVEGGL